MDIPLLKQVLNEYSIKREKAISDAENRKKELEEANPRISEIDSEISKKSLEASKKVLTLEEKEKKQVLTDLKKETSSLLKEKETILKDISKTSNYLKPKFECSLCEDTGYVQRNGKSVMCSCLKQRLFDLAYNKSNMGNLERENFSNFNIRYFSDKPDKARFKSDKSPRENMNLLKEKAMNFIENFDDPDEKNLVFTGGTGLGKTYLSNCIASEMLKQGKTVLYQTSPVMFEDILDEKFEKSNNGLSLMDNILTVDLLIIDDLGTEKVTESKITELFNIINTRLLNQNHVITKTIISTNLTVDEIFSTYTSRIGSRLAGSYRILRFFGDDIRLKKGKKEI